MWVDGNFNASSGLDSQYDKPNLQFGPVLQPVVDILQILATLTGNDFDKGMDVGMSNSPDNWEYKFNCSKEIPVIQFPSPEELTLDPNTAAEARSGFESRLLLQRSLVHSYRPQATRPGMRRIRRLPRWPARHVLLAAGRQHLCRRPGRSGHCSRYQSRYRRCT